jgi:hypothetical protein
LTRRSSSFWRQFQAEPDASMKETLTAQWRAAALSLFEEAAGHAANAAIPSHRADKLWQRMEALEPCISLGFDQSVREAVNISLGLNSEAVTAIPDDWVQSLAEVHSLATLRYRDEYEQEFRRRLQQDGIISSDHQDLAAAFREVKDAGALQTIRDIWASTPNRMFGPPSYVQGAAEDFVDDWLLLLELSGADSIGMPMGEGVFQFMIRPQDLADLRFDRVKAIASGY